jgi:hypothetical protein
MWLTFSPLSASRGAPSRSTTYASGAVVGFGTISVYVGNPTAAPVKFTVTLRQLDGTVIRRHAATVPARETQVFFDACPGQAIDGPCEFTAIVSSRSARLAPSLAYDVEASDKNGLRTGFIRYQLPAGGFRTATS